MKQSRSQFLTIRSLRYHVRTWGREGAPKLFLLHGWGDVSASYQFFVDALKHDWLVLAPDWRGYGETIDPGADTYWQPDLYADLDAILRQFQPEGAINLLGHSMGAQVACTYAGLRPERFQRVINVEGYGLGNAGAGGTPKRFLRWLDSLKANAPGKDFANFEELAERIRRREGRITPERASFVARHWGRLAPSGRVELATHPSLQNFRVNPLRFRADEVEATWRAVTARVLWVQAMDSRTPGGNGLSAEEVAGRKACFARREDVFMPDTGHMVHLERPEELAEHAERFLLAA